MNKKYNLKLDLQFRCNNSIMKFNQFDSNTSDFFMRITNGGNLVDIEKAIVVLAVIKPSGKVASQFVEVKNGLVYADLKPSMIDELGIYTAQAMLILEDERVVTDVISYEVEEDKIFSLLNDTVEATEEFTLLADMLSRLSTIEISEEQRMINEAERILSEENRKIEEAKRVEAELVRQHEEADRTKYDATRESNENIRKINEEARISSENVRLENEANRIEQETNRVKAEQLRKDNYNFMTEDEERRRLEANAHKEAEVLRVQAETNRVNEEAKRRTTEQARVLAENTRVSNENTRKANEETRQNNETHRVEAETQRQSRYNSFIADAEANANNFENYTNTVKVKEEERKANELDRKSQEDRRISNEVERISNENTRKANEVVREKNEASRQNTFTNKVNEVDKRIVEMNTTKDNFISNINTKVDTKISELDTAKSDMTNTVTNKIDEVENRFNALTAKQQQDAEVIDARDGEVSLKARLDRDIEKAKQVYAPIEGNYISTDSSSGYAKDVEILGNTIQDASNLADIRSVGDTVEGQELYEIPVLCTNGLDSTDSNYQEDKLTILSPVQIEKVGNVADRIICKDGVWGVEKDVKTIDISKYRLSSVQRSLETIQSFFINVNGENVGTKIRQTFCNIIPYNNGNGYNNDVECVYSDDLVADRIWFHVNKDKFETLDYDCISNWINENKPIVKICTTQPKFIPLPHDQQVKLRTFANKTNISFLAEIEGTIKAQVPKSLGATVNTHTEQISNLNKELDRVKKLEESTVSTITTESDFTTVEATSGGYFEDVKLEGKTLINLFNFKAVGIANEVNIYGYAQNYELTKGKEVTLVNNTDKVVIYDISKDSIWVRSYILNANTCIKATLEESEYIRCCYGAGARGWDANSESDKEKIKKTCIVLEGDHTQNLPNYFEGLKSVGQSGTTSEDGADEIVVSSVKGDGNLFDIDSMVDGYYIDQASGDVLVNNARSCSFDYIPINCNTLHFSQNSGLEQLAIHCYDVNKNWLGCNTTAKVEYVAINLFPNTSYIRLAYAKVKREYSDNCIYLSKINSAYTPHQADKKRLLYYNEETQTWEKPILREWDSIEKHSDGKYYYHVRSKEGDYVEGDESLNDCITDLTVSVKKLAEEKVYECTNIDLITYANETNYIVECGAISPKTTLKVHNNISNVVSLLQKKVSLLENNITSYMITQNRLMLASRYNADTVSFKVDVATLRNSFEYDNDLYELILNNILVGKDNYNREYIENLIIFYWMDFVISDEMHSTLFEIIEEQHNPKTVEDQEETPLI